MLKQFVVVPKKPKMSTGKIASQVAHATFMALIKQQNSEGKDLIAKWANTGMCVIVCQVPSQTELIGLKEYCEQWNIPGHAYVDEGFTEIPMGTFTAFATGVIPEDKQVFFSQLKLWE